MAALTLPFSLYELPSLRPLAVQMQKADSQGNNGKWFTIPGYSYINADAHGARLDRLNAGLNDRTVFVPRVNANQVAQADPRLGTRRFWERGRVTGEPGQTDITTEMQAHRPARGSGQFDFEGHKYHWASGIDGHPTTPLGSTQIGDPHHGPKVPDGYEIPEAQGLHDPLKRGHGDDNIVLHGTSSDDLDQMYTLGWAFARASGRASSRTWPSTPRRMAGSIPT